MSASPPAPAATPMVEFERVTRRLDAGPVAVADLSFGVARGELAVFEGGNGAGKTALLRLAAGLDAPTSGTVRAAATSACRSTPCWLRAG